MSRAKQREKIEKLVKEFHSVYPDKAGRHPDLIIDDLVTLNTKAHQSGYEEAVKKNNEIYKWAIIENIVIFIIVGFLVWKVTKWGLILLFFVKTVRTKKND